MYLAILNGPKSALIKATCIINHYVLEILLDMRRVVLAGQKVANI